MLTADLLHHDGPQDDFQSAGSCPPILVVLFFFGWEMFFRFLYTFLDQIVWIFIMYMYIPLFQTQGIHVTVKRGDIAKKRERKQNTCVHLLYIFVICLVYISMCT